MPSCAVYPCSLLDIILLLATVLEGLVHCLHAAWHISDAPNDTVASHLNCLQTCLPWLHNYPQCILAW